MPRRELTLYYASLSPMDAVSLLGSWAAQAWRAPEVDRRALAALGAMSVGAEHALLFGSARSALYALLKAIGVGPGDEVLVTGLTCVAVPLAVVAHGARPVYVDVDPLSLNATTEATIARIGPRVRAVIVQHTFGNPAPVEAIVEAVRGRGIALIEDCALALGSTRRGQPVGSFGDAAVFSFELSKTITTGWGGMLAVRNPELARGVTAIYRDMSEPAAITRDVWQTVLSAVCHRPAVYPVAKYAVAALFKAGVFRPSTPAAELDGTIGARFLERMSGPQARLGVRLWRRLPELVARLQWVGGRMRSALADNGFTPLASPAVGDMSAAARIPFLVSDPAGAVRWFAREGIELGRWFDAPVAPMPRNPTRFGYAPGACGCAERVSRHIVNLPSHVRLSEDDVSRIAGALSRYRETVPSSLLEVR